MIKGKEYYVEYEGIHQICFCCGRIDHDQKNCPTKKNTTEKMVNSEDLNNNENREENQRNMTETNHQTFNAGKEIRVQDSGKQPAKEKSNEFGNWMVVQGPKRGRRNQIEESHRFGEGTSKQKEHQHAKGNQSRFNVLTIEETQEENNNEEVEKQTNGEQEGSNKQGSNNKSPKVAKTTESKETNKSSIQPENPRSTNPSISTRNLSKENQETVVARYNENWKPEDDSTQIQDTMEEDTQEVENNIGEGRPPDPGEENNIHNIHMNTDLQKQIE
ncbi:hypothetical protein PIB30_040321 [Stylosanthes scabra]|uniref:CCHC-type domain-containing protein n=1 Tax=Stylosanthes scabra TaxID=79078 RepID=A0ABU6SEH1_9FABA|nr:hypothetical protein [Stylosanthes scabra]